jgi:hypothetical protein
MNTIEKEPKQGADTAADLKKQKPQEEVLKLKSSTASSEEGKFATGIMTMGLRTKKISRTKKKKARKRKKNEGGNLDRKTKQEYSTISR